METSNITQVIVYEKYIYCNPNALQPWLKCGKP